MKPAKGLRRYFEWLSRGRRTGRAAYVLNDRDLPEPLPGAEWQLDQQFNAAEELLSNPNLKAAIAAALKNGVEIVNTAEKAEVKVSLTPSPDLPSDTLLQDVHLPSRIQKALAAAGLRTVGEVRQTSASALLTFQDIGQRSVAYIREHLG
jgi:DNA-directed RNA polymerase alpha subunit